MNKTKKASGLQNMDRVDKSGAWCENSRKGAGMLGELSFWELKQFAALPKEQRVELISSTRDIVNSAIYKMMGV